MNTLRELDLNLPERNRLLFLIAVGLGVAALLGHLLLLGSVLYPRWQQWQEASDLLTEARRQLRAAQREQESQTPERVRAEIEAARAELTEEAAIFLGQDEAAAALDRLYRYADETGINILSLQSDTAPPSEAEEASTLYSVQSFRLEAQGEINDLLNFLGQIEESAYLGFNVTNVMLEAGTSGTKLTFDLVLYTSPYATGAQPPAEGDSAEALLEQAWQAGRWQQAIDLLNELLQADPSNERWLERLYRARVNYGNELLEDGRAAAARTQFEIALQIDPTGTAAAAGLAQVEALLTPTPAPEATLEEQLDAVWEAEDWETAIALLEQLRNLEPAEPSWTEKLYAAEVNHGYQLMGEGDYQEAKEAFSRALELKPGGAEAQEGLRLLSDEGTPVPSPSTPRPTATQPTVRVYTVRRGDTLYSIARRFGVTLEALMAANNLTNYNIAVGQQLRIPAP